MKPLSAYRAQFPILERWRYFMNNTHSAMPSSVEQSLAKFTRMWNENGGESWDEWIGQSTRVADQIGRLIGASAGTVSIQTNVSTALAKLFSCFDFKASRRNKIVYTDMEFPTIHYLADAWGAYGARFVKVPSRDGVGVALEDLLAEIDEETLLVPTCHVFFNSSYRQDMKAIIKKAHSVGAMVCADIYQSAGAMPIDVKEWNVDFAVGGSHKYLCGGSGTCYIYVRPDHLNLEPKITGWLSHRDPFAMKNDPMDWCEGISRWTGGAPAVAPLYIAPCGMTILEEIGMKRVREESEKHTERLIHWADELKLTLKTPRNVGERGASVHVTFDGVENVQEYLKKNGYLVHYRPAFHLRIAPHFYNTLEEIDGFMKTVAEFRKQL